MRSGGAWGGHTGEEATRVGMRNPRDLKNAAFKPEIWPHERRVVTLGNQGLGLTDRLAGAGRRMMS
jgi:hypothetical protein